MQKDRSRYDDRTKWEYATRARARIREYARVNKLQKNTIIASAIGKKVDRTIRLCDNILFVFDANEKY